MPIVKRTVNAGECACLGWCGKKFFSPDKTRIRYCFKCREKYNKNQGLLSRSEVRASAQSVPEE